MIQFFAYCKSLELQIEYIRFTYVLNIYGFFKTNLG